MQDGGATSEIDIPIAPTDMHPGMRIVVNGMRSGKIDRAGFDHRAHASARRLCGAGSRPRRTPRCSSSCSPSSRRRRTTGIYTPFWGQACDSGRHVHRLEQRGGLLVEIRRSASRRCTWHASRRGSPRAFRRQRRAITRASRPRRAGWPRTRATSWRTIRRFVYVFTNVAACGWAGLGEVPGTQAWSNESNTLSVIGHEVGHTFGLGHANSLPCNGVTIATNCPLGRPEYGDPWDIMGNQSTAQVNAWQKNDMGWVPDAKVAKHPGGTASYTLSPLSSPGGAIYAVQVPAAVHRTYWIEYRQPAGFDATLPASATNGAIIHLGGLMHQPDRSEYGCWDTCFLDMVPATATDGRRRAGRIQGVRRLADRRDDHRRLEGRGWTNGVGGESADARRPGNLSQAKRVKRAGLQVLPGLRVGRGRGCEDPVRHGRRHSADRQFHERRTDQHRRLPQRRLVLRHQS